MDISLIYRRGSKLVAHHPMAPARDQERKRQKGVDKSDHISCAAQYARARGPAFENNQGKSTDREEITERHTLNVRCRRP
jgi:hypothetical protein